MKTFICIGFVSTIMLTLWLPSPPRALGGGEEAISLQEVIEEALHNNPELRAMRLRSKEAEARVPQVSSLDDPYLVITQWGIPADFDITRTDEIWYGIGQRFPFPGKLSLRGEGARKEVQVRQAEYRAKEREIIARVTVAYYDLFLVRKAIEINEHNRDLIRQFSQNAEALFSVGKVSQQDVVKGLLEFSRIINDLIVLVEQDKRVAEDELNILLNRPVHTPVGSPQEPPDPVFSYSFEELERLAIENRPELAAAAFAREKEETEVALAKKGYYPDFEVELTRWQVREGPDQWMAMVKMNIPWVFTVKYDSRITETMAGIERAQAEENIAKNLAHLEVRHHFLKAKTAEKVAHLYKTTLLPQATQVVEAATASYKTGRADFLTLIESQRALKEVELGYFKAKVDFEKNRALLERAVGVDLTRKEGGR